MRRVCVFCGSSLGSRPAYAGAARRLGEALARRRIGLVDGDPEALLDRLEGYAPPAVQKWIDKEST